MEVGQGPKGALAPKEKKLELIIRCCENVYGVDAQQ
jgi:hypothetical protein